ncbi:phosphatidylethanolamine-binding protein [Hygrophoropsis aurantiaca]|uniref:Phosphatidylethanolamine-binding protein n=1 Tax=Hygrophoropsis aurantiaca TaxID=72124 RepID=A0ACB8AGK8_9AGAM|nr:phosphatidylethanolamine-binding protein [Hygrophoropsis aurantiaca]
MLAVRRLRSRAFVFARGNATLQTTSTSEISEAVEAETIPSEAITPARKTRLLKTRRPKISPQNPREWSRPLAFGVLPAFDEALKVIKADSVVLKQELEEVRVSIERVKEAPERDDIVLQKLEEKLRILEVQSEINFPETRWKVANGMADMSKAVDRYLVEKKWRKRGALDLLMERVHQMHVVPDVLPDLHPSLDLRVAFPEASSGQGSEDNSTKIKYSQVEPGTFLVPEQTVNPPMIYTSVFHPEPRQYTLLMVDPDVPDESNQTFQTFVHWLQPNIELSALSPSPLQNINSHTLYIPPHPQRGTPYHRYTLLLLPQKSRVSIPILSKEARRGFDVRAFTEQYGLDSSTGGGAHMWREVWSEGVSGIYSNILKVDEPKFGIPPKADRYAHLKRSKRYV